MDEVLEFCIRVLGPGAPAGAAAREAASQGQRERVELLAAAARACRARSEQPWSAPDDPEPATLAQAVARELAQATANLPERQREALALRECMRLSHTQIARVLGIGPAAVAPLLVRARLQLRTERRPGATAAGSGQRCEERNRALRLLVLRQDSEPIGAEDDEWLHAHLNGCGPCRRDHAAMLEASACYRAWRVEAEPEDAPAGRMLSENALR